MKNVSSGWIRGVALTFGVFTSAQGEVEAKDYAPANCTGARPYEGPPLFAGRVEFPSDDRFDGKAFDTPVAQRLDRALEDAMRRTKAAHMSASVATSAALWSGTRSAEGAAQYQRFYWASVGKVLTAVVVLQLVDEGKLSLTDPVSRWVPKLPKGQFITIDHLLTHTAGLFSANEDAKVRKEHRYLTPDETIRIAMQHGLMFCPGQAWRYSNTGYTILGKIIEAVEGRPYHEVVNHRIAGRLELLTLRALAPEETPSDVAPLRPANGAEPEIAPSWPYAAGDVVGSTEDMLRFWQAVLTKKLLSPESTARLFERLYPMFDVGTYYGRGVMLYQLPSGSGSKEIWLGHSGGTPGAKALVAYAPSDHAFVAVALSGDGSAEASAHLLIQQLVEPRLEAEHHGD